MSHRTQAGIAAVAALILAGGAFFWLHGRADVASRAMVPAPPIPVPGKTSSEAPKEAANNERPPRTEMKKAIAEPEPGPAMRGGEVLEYSADLAKVSDVASLRLQVAERRNFLGKNAWHLQAFAHTQNPLRMVFELDDQFDSYSDAGTLASLQYEMHLSERGQKVESIQRMTTTGKEPAPANVTETRVLPGTRDPLGMMQYLRNVDWAKARDVRGPVYDGHKLYDVRASLAGVSERVAVPAGNYVATKVELRVFDDGAEMKDAHFAVYFAHDEMHTPVLLEAVLPWTTARVGLKSSK